ncbi:MAG: hypothetical protein ACJ8R9_28850 [Steroidobacteraceae bacterium]
MNGALHLRTCMNRIFVTAVIAMMACAAGRVSADDGDHSKVLGSIHIAAGEHADDASTVNGSIEIGANAAVKHADTVNGNVTLHEHSTAASVQTVNGSARIEQGARVSGNIVLVNGHISLDKDADVAGRLTNVNGAIQLDGAHVGGGIETSTGDIQIGPNSRVEGGILVNDSEQSWISFGKPKVPRVVIGPGAVIKGPLAFRREVKLYVSDRATIGAVEGATANKFSGERP